MKATKPHCAFCTLVASVREAQKHPSDTAIRNAKAKAEQVPGNPGDAALWLLEVTSNCPVHQIRRDLEAPLFDLQRRLEELASIERLSKW